MSRPDEPDPELAAIRARRLRELGERRTASAPIEPPPRVTPVDLDSTSFGPFLASHRDVVVDVWAPWCGPCRAMAPVLDALASELAPRLHFAKVNADSEPALVARWKVLGIPTLLLFREGTLVDRILGAQPSERLRERFERSLPAPSGPPEG
jgi:thioredoxin 1